MRDGDARWSTREDEDDDDATREDDGEVRARRTREGDDAKRARRDARGGAAAKVRGFARWVTRAREEGGVDARCERLGMGGGGEMRSFRSVPFVRRDRGAVCARGDGGGRARRGERERD